jgi:2-C-methyl-D-erythritol 4-phosphate cytidylyltransferase
MALRSWPSINNMKKYAVIVAGGAGVRMGGALPKQFLLLRGKPVLWYTLNTFLSAYADLSVILVVSGDYRPAGLDVAASTGAPGRIRMADGGVTRFHSVRNGLELIGEESIVFVHDGVRCLLTTALVHRCYEAALQFGSAIPVVDSRDSVRFLTGNGSEAVERSRVRLVQTPQTFRSDVLQHAYQAEYSLQFTDEATVVEASGHPVHLVEGETDNIKLTHPMDLVVAERLLKERE